MQRGRRGLLKVADRLNLIVYCRRHACSLFGEQTGRRFQLEFSIGRQKLHAQGTQTAGRQAGAACLPRVHGRPGSCLLKVN